VPGGENEISIATIKDRFRPQSRENDDMTDPTSRVLELLGLLQTHRFWSGNELADRLSVSPRTLRRDIDRLRTLGYPVDATPGAAGGYRLAAGAHMPPLLLDDDEAVAIAVGLRSAAGAAVEGIEDTAVRALAKLDHVLPDRLRRRVGAVHATVVPMRPAVTDGPVVEAATLAHLSQACLDGEEVRFEYQRRDGVEGRRLVEPHQLVSTGRRWYLVAWDMRRDDWRTFRVDRLSEARLAGRRFTRRQIPGGDAAAFVARSIGNMPTRYAAELVVDGPPDHVSMATRAISGTVDDLGDGRCRVRMGADSAEWLAFVVAELAVYYDVGVVDAPPEVHAAVARLAARLQAIDGDG
jgi:predicted DNA-binding transcriptional regulator YafY